MAEIIDTSSSRDIEPDTWIVTLKPGTSKDALYKQVEQVDHRSTNRDGDDRYYRGVVHVYDSIPGYAGVFPREVVRWIREQKEFHSIDEDVEGRIRDGDN